MDGHVSYKCMHLDEKYYNPIREVFSWNFELAINIRIIS
jgi:hypothetical protein